MNLVGALTLGAVDQVLARPLDGNDGGAVSIDVNGIPPSGTKVRHVSGSRAQTKAYKLFLG